MRIYIIVKVTVIFQKRITNSNLRSSWLNKKLSPMHRPMSSRYPENTTQLRPAMNGQVNATFASSEYVWNNGMIKEFKH